MTRTSEGAIETVEFVQKEADCLTVRILGQTLATTTHPHSSGLSKIEYNTTFSPPWDGQHTEWTADCVYKRTARDGTDDQFETRVVVEFFTSDPDEIDRRMDQFVSLIPNGTPLQQGNENPISHVWADGKVVRHLDTSAIALAAEAEFKSSTNRRWLWLLLAITAVAGVAIFWIRRDSRGNS